MLGPKLQAMKYQILAGIGLAAVIAFCGYMITQLDARRSGLPEAEARRVAIVKP